MRNLVRLACLGAAALLAAGSAALAQSGPLPDTAIADPFGDPLAQHVPIPPTRMLDPLSPWQPLVIDKRLHPPPEPFTLPQPNLRPSVIGEEALAPKTAGALVPGMKTLAPLGAPPNAALDRRWLNGPAN